MRPWKQLLISMIILAIGLVATIRLVPSVADIAGQWGVPVAWLAMVAPPVTTADGKPSSAPVEAPPNGNRRNGAQGGFGGPALVVLKPVTIGKVNDRLTAIGNGDALRSVTVTPSVNGTLAEVLVKSGDRIAGGGVIARLDEEGEKLALEKARVTLKSAEEILTRNRELKSIVSRADLAKSETDADTARLQLAEAGLDLKRRTILAPIGGVAGIVAVTTGDYVTTATSIVTIDDRSRLIIDFWVPERFSALVSVGAPVAANAIARPGETYKGEISAIDSRIDQLSRTLHLQATIANDQDRLRAGMSFNVTMEFAGERYPAVDPLAIQWDSQGSYIWRVKDGAAARVPVRIIERNSDSVLVDAALKQGETIVIEGVQRVRQGGRVMEAGDKPGQDGAAAAAPTARNAKTSTAKAATP